MSLACRLAQELLDGDRDRLAALLGDVDAALQVTEG